MTAGATSASVSARHKRSTLRREFGGVADNKDIGGASYTLQDKLQKHVLEQQAATGSSQCHWMQYATGRSPWLWHHLRTCENSFFIFNMIRRSALIHQKSS
jgi:hypothetical protein